MIRTKLNFTPENYTVEALNEALKAISLQIEKMTPALKMKTIIKCKEKIMKFI